MEVRKTSTEKNSAFRTFQIISRPVSVFWLLRKLFWDPWICLTNHCVELPEPANSPWNHTSPALRTGTGKIQMLFTEYSLSFATSLFISHRNLIEERLEQHIITPHSSSILNSFFTSPRLSKDLLHVKLRYSFWKSLNLSSLNSWACY